MRVRAGPTLARSASLAPLLSLVGHERPAADDRAAARGKSGCAAQRRDRGLLHLAADGAPTTRPCSAAPAPLFDAAGPGDTIRVAMFRWDIKPPTDALIAAQRRGAVVYLVGDDDLRLNRHGRRLVETIEDQDPDRENVTICDGACLPVAGTRPLSRTARTSST